MTRKLSNAVLVLMFIMGAPGLVLANSGYLSSFNSTYPAASGSRISNCLLCHTTSSGGSRNSYGTAYANAGHSFTAIASSDSDGDGYTNSAEITALTYPGNAANHPGGTTTATLTGLAIQGPGSVNGGTTATYTALASYSDGSSGNVTATWSVVPTTYATISTSGVLTAKTVTASQTVTIGARYTQSGVTKSASASVTVANGTAANSGIGSVNNSGVIVLASNDLGMHCACPGFSYFMLLPPYNTIRAQVIRKNGEDPQVLGASSGIRVAYSIAENTNASLSADPYYKDWMTNAPKLGFTAFPVKDANGRIQSPITGAKLAGNMKAKSPGWWEAVGIPAYPDRSKLSAASAKTLIDPLGGPNRNPYLTGNIKVYDQSNKLLAQTSVTVPVAFGGCCSCHLNVAKDLNYPATPEGSFEAMGFLHSQNSSGMNVALIDPDGDGVPGPIRCSQCHLDPAMGDKTPPGGYKLNGKALRVSKFTFSDVLHRFHVQDSMVLSQYDANIARNCYQCHPGNGINCYRDHHTNESMNGATKLWCTDCHGNLNQRVSQKQMLQPWSTATLPKCAKCHTGTIGESPTLGVFGGAFLNSMTHGGPLLCSTCHGSPHALNASTLPHDNMQNAALQGGNAGPIGQCNVCHTGRSGYGKPPHSRGD